MAKRKLDRDRRRALTDARQLIEGVYKTDGNEAETRRRVERLFQSLMGYDPFKHLSREHAIKGVGDTEHVDFAIHVEGVDEGAPTIMVELKRASSDLNTKHLKQVSTYAINAGCERLLLTNGRQWRVYHVSFEQPPVTNQIAAWDLLEDEPEQVSEMFDLVSFRSVSRGKLDEKWRTHSVLKARNLMEVLVGEQSIRLIRRELRKATDVLVSPEDVLRGIRRLLNETAIAELEDMEIKLPERKRRRTRKAAATPTAGEPAEADKQTQDDSPIDDDQTTTG